MARAASDVRAVARRLSSRRRDHAEGVDADLLHGVRQLAAGAFDAVAHLGLGQVHVHAGAEGDPEADRILTRVRVDVLDAGERAHLLLDRPRDLLFVLLSAGPRVEHADPHTRLDDAFGHQLQRDARV